MRVEKTLWLDISKCRFQQGNTRSIVKKPRGIDRRSKRFMKLCRSIIGLCVPHWRLPISWRQRCAEITNLSDHCGTTIAISDKAFRYLHGGGVDQRYQKEHWPAAHNYLLRKNSSQRHALHSGSMLKHVNLATINVRMNVLNYPGLETSLTETLVYCTTTYWFNINLLTLPLNYSWIVEI